METSSIYWEKTSRLPAQRAIVVRNTTPRSPINTPAKSPDRSESRERSPATERPRSNHSSIGHSSALGSRGISYSSPYHPPLQHPVVRQLLTPPDSVHEPDDYTPTATMSAGQADCLQSLLSLAWPDDQSNQVAWMTPSPELARSPSPAETDADLDDSEDPENVIGTLVSLLPLDRNVQSNNLPFLLQAHALWISRFLFEPLRVIHLARDYILRVYSLGEESRWRSNLLANNVYEIVRSANYDLGNVPSFFTIHAFILRALTEASSYFEASRELDRQYALGAMLNTYELISSLCHVASLSSVLKALQTAAPVFRRACPDPLRSLINLPALLTTINIPLQFYGTLDVLLGVLTGRPMFFRYDVEFTPEAPESLFFLEDGPALRWLYGVPDRLVITLAKMNALYEDFGSRVEKHVVDELEVEIKDMRAIVGDTIDPSLLVARVVVQECWLLAALIYLYMGLCGANALDSRVMNVKTQLNRILSTIQPRRNPDMFLVSPMLLLGIATDDPYERITIRQRMLGVSECSRPGTLGNDYLRVLDNVWALKRPVVWSDLRQAVWEVSGM